MAIIAIFIEGQQVHQMLDGVSGSISNTLDFAVTNVASADVVEALKVGEGMMITAVRTRVITAEGGISTVDVGDGADPNGYGAGNDTNAAVGTIEKSMEADAYGVGRYYSAEDTIDLVTTANLTACKIQVTAEYVRV